MKLIIFFALAMTLHSLQALACPDLSGHYRPFYETDADDVVTTVDYTQYGCDSLSIGGMVLGKLHFENQSKVFGIQHLSLKGLPPPAGLNCLWNSFSGVCASYLATDSAIIKTVLQPAPAVDPTHGTCFFTVSKLTKNAKGDLIETPVALNCDDGYKGEVTPLVWLKAN